MAYGAIHEITAAQSYRRMMTLADHPVLTKILTAIIREEARACPRGRRRGSGSDPRIGRPERRTGRQFVDRQNAG
ncbi:MAG: hypothetical protein LC734_11280 [Acidobacteria bacterium]|nr:hypothetical protein [Acidobacteriota bacterium]